MRLLKICKFYLLIIIIITFKWNFANAQSPTGVSNFTGNFEINAQTYKADSAIEAPAVSEKILSNGFLNLNYNYNNFSAGIRYEAYQNPLLGFDAGYKGSGIAYRFASFTSDNLTITAGNFYEQFGNGLILRTYEQKSLGIDNAFDGLRVQYVPFKGVTVKAFIGEQKVYFIKGAGLVRGIDGDFQLNDFLPGWDAKKLKIALGGSFVSKYEKDNVASRVLPENVGASAGRLSLIYNKFSFNGEYAYKINDPSLNNKYIYKPGQAIYLNATYAKKGLGIKVTSKWLDNMSFRSERGASLNNLSINYLPAISKTYTYRLSTLYPNATQPQGESGYSGEVYYSMKPNSKLGGHYGTTISINASTVSDIDRTPASNDTLGYESKIFSMGNNIFYQDFSLEISKKISKSLKLIATYIYQVYDKNKIEGKTDYQQVTAHIAVVDITKKITPLKSIRLEIQHLSTEQDRGNWAMGLVEFTVAPHWAVNAFDEWNYGNENSEKRFHFYNLGFSYSANATTIGLSYARQRGGLLCVGGVCRQVYASNGFNINITSRF